MQRSTTWQCADYGAQVEGKINSECRGPEYSGDGHHTRSLRRGSRSSSNSSDSARSGSGRSPNRGSPVPGYLKSRSRRIDSSEAMAVKQESQTQFYKVDELEFAKFGFFYGLQELSIALSIREMLVILADRNIPALMADREFLQKTASKK